MIQVRNLVKAYGLNVLFNEAGFVMSAGERVGLVGRNGHGKSTLFRILLGMETADGGEVIVPKRYRIGHLSQHLKFDSDTVLQEACSALPKSEDGTDLSYRAEAALHGLGFEPPLFESPPGELSGGYQVRLNLAKVLVSEPNLLLLDEPTNYLDIVSMRWLERFLGTWRFEMMLITHDRDFMDSVTTHTMAIHRSKLRKVEGPTGKIFAQIAQDEEIHEKTRLNQERSRRQQERFIERFRAKSTKARAVQSRVKMLEKKGSLERLEEINDLSFRFRSTSFPGKRIMEVQDLSFHYDGGPVLIQGLSFRMAARDRIGVIGHNGRGKTTLLSLLAGVFTPVSGSIRLHPSAQTAYFGQMNVERLDPEKSVEEEILAVHPDGSRGAARGVCGLMMFEGDDALKKVKVLSGGERSRVLLGKLLVSPSNLLILDEPTNHLDMQSTEGLMEALERFEGAVVIVTHSERILRRVANRLVVFDGGKTLLFEGGYEDFLERIGWEDEGPPDRTIFPPSPRGTNRKELRRARARLTAERSRRVTPLARRIKEVEEAITVREKKDKEMEVLLCEAAAKGEVEPMVLLGKQSEAIKSEIQDLFQELERLTGEYEELRRELEGEPV